MKTQFQQHVAQLVHVYIITFSLSSCSFPSTLKYADLRPAFKKDDKIVKKNYRPIRILQSLVKAYDRLMHDQKYPFFDQIFPNLQGRFYVGLNKEQCLIHLTEEQSKCLVLITVSMISLPHYESFFFFYNNVYTKLKTNIKKTYNSASKIIYCVSRGRT